MFRTIIELLLIFMQTNFCLYSVIYLYNILINNYCVDCVES